MRGKGVAAAVMAAVLVFPCVAGAQEPDQVTGLTAAQDIGFTTLKWNPVAGATDYQIERTPVDASGRRPVRRRSSASGSRSARSRRTSRPSRSRATRSAAATSGACGRASAPVRRGEAVLDAGAGTTLGHPFPGTPDGLVPVGRRARTTTSTPATSRRRDYTATLDAASDRMRVVEQARTLQTGR